MTIEHERKFVVRDANFVRRIGHEAHGERLAQGYLVERDGTSVRVRILANKTGLLTYKGRRAGDKRIELEDDLSPELAEALLSMCETRIDKVRVPVAEGGLDFDVDVFLGANRGLVLAEIEDPPDDLAPPPWCDSDVTDDERFYNQYLAHTPFEGWPDRERWSVDWE